MPNVAPLDSIPIAALLARGDVIVAANPAYEELMSIRADQIVGRTVSDLIAQFVNTPDNAMVESAADATDCSSRFSRREQQARELASPSYDVSLKRTKGGSK